MTSKATGYILPTDNAHELLEAVEDFLSRSDKEEMKIMARNSVAGRTWDRVNGELLSHYRAVMKQSNVLLESEQVA